jgi:hypothetical protein
MLRLLILLGLLMNFVSTANATPAFARQMGVSCTACHSQNSYPSLNAFGRKFKASGFTMMVSQALIKGDEEQTNSLSLPTTLNTAFITKLRAKKGNKSDSVLEFPDEAAVILGGRISKNIGTFIEIGYDSADNKFGLANFKLPITYNINNYTLGIVPFRTDGFGAAGAFEVLNTGAVRGSRVLEDRKAISAQQYIGTATTAEGVGTYLYTDLWHVVYTAYVPNNGRVHSYSPAHYLRLAMTPQINGWDLGFGGQLWKGTSETLESGKNTTDAYAVDFQAMGQINKIPVSFFATHAKAKADATSLYNSSPNDKSATTILSEVGVIPSLLSISAGYRIADNGHATNASDDKAIIGAKYFLAENMQVQLNYTHSPDSQPLDDKDHLLLMFYGGF